MRAGWRRLFPLLDDVRMFAEARRINMSLRNVTPTAHAHRFEVNLMPKPTIIFMMMPTAPEGMFSKAAAFDENPNFLIKVVEYVPVRPADIAPWKYS
jgi:hypothetical protein